MVGGLRRREIRSVNRFTVWEVGSVVHSEEEGSVNLPEETGVLSRGYFTVE